MKNSIRSVLKSLIANDISSIPISADITMAVSMGTGSQPMKGVPTRRMSTMVMEATRDIICERTLYWSAMPLRDTEPLTGQHPEREAANIPTVYARSSCLPFMCWPFFIAKFCVASRVSAVMTIAITREVLIRSFG